MLSNLKAMMVKYTKSLRMEQMKVLESMLIHRSIQHNQQIKQFLIKHINKLIIHQKKLEKRKGRSFTLDNTNLIKQQKRT